MEEPIETWLKAAAPILKAVESPAQVEPPARHQEAFLQAVAKKSALAKPAALLTPQQMEAVILHLLRENGMDGLELIGVLDSKKLHCQEKGEGVIYGILNKLEAKGFLQSRWRESSARMVKSYHITEKGGTHLYKHASTLIVLPC
ncbi:MAG: PadR family transcriptional regulator [Blastochloris sp.]|nr:PadR family transcriptional regulator [Blastochloris sp.]